MARADRLERADRLRDMLESEYREHLLVALQNAAAGVWGLFGHQQDRAALARTAPVLERLTELAEAIDKQRLLLGLECFALHQEFLAARGPVKSNAVGEPRQAKAWLEPLTTSHPSPSSRA